MEALEKIKRDIQDKRNHSSQGGIHVSANHLMELIRQFQVLDSERDAHHIPITADYYTHLKALITAAYYRSDKDVVKTMMIAMEVVSDLHKKEGIDNPPHLSKQHSPRNHRPRFNATW